MWLSKYLSNKIYGWLGYVKVNNFSTKLAKIGQHERYNWLLIRANNPQAGMTRCTSPVQSYAIDMLCMQIISINIIMMHMVHFSYYMYLIVR